MLNKVRQLKKESSGAKAAGFTIIEVMIVLAIAGIIMAIVFLAIPGLQRSNRNTQRKNDAARVSGLINDYVANNNGKLPTGFGAASGQLNLANETLSILTKPTGNIVVLPSPIPAAQRPTTADTVVVFKSAICGTNAGDDPGAGNTRQYAVWYYTEGTQSSACISN